MPSTTTSRSPRIRSKTKDWIVILAITLALHAAFFLFFKPRYFRIFKLDVTGDEGESYFPSLDRPFNLIPYPEPSEETKKAARTEPVEAEPEKTIVAIEDDFGEPPTELMPIERGSAGGRDGARGQRRLTIEPKPLFIPWPKYPAGIDDDAEGKVELLLFVNEEGTVEDVKVTRALPHQELNDIAVESAKKIRFTPGMEKGVPTAMWVRLMIGFQPR